MYNKTKEQQVFFQRIPSVNMCGSTRAKGKGTLSGVGWRQVERRDCFYVLQGRVQQAFIRRWSVLLVCSAVRAFCTSLMDSRPVFGLRSRGCPSSE